MHNYWSLRKRIILKIYDLIDSSILFDQRPLRIFYWMVIGIENELKHPEGTQETIREIVYDPIREQFIGRIRVGALSKKTRIIIKEYVIEITKASCLTIKKNNNKKFERNMLRE